MYSASAPAAAFGAALNVLLETVVVSETLTSSAVAPFAGLLRGRISSEPLELSPSEPTPYQVFTMSSSVVVAPALMSMSVCLTPFVTSSGVKVS